MERQHGQLSEHDLKHRGHDGRLVVTGKRGGDHDPQGLGVRYYGRGPRMDWCRQSADQMNIVEWGLGRRLAIVRGNCRGRERVDQRFS